MFSKSFNSKIGKIFINPTVSERFHGGLRVKNKNLYKKKPLITIITVVKDNPKLLEKCILSIAQQKFRNFEHIIIDGGSREDTLSVIRKNERHISYWISQNDKGIYDAFNRGLNYALGDVIGFVNSDDTLNKNALKILSNYLNKYPNKDFFFGSVKKHWGILYGYKSWKINFTWNFYSAHSCGFFIRKQSARKIGYYNTNYRYHADYDYFYRMIKHHKLDGVGTNKNELFGIFNRGGFSSKQKFKDHIYESSVIRLNNGQSKFFVILSALAKILYNKKRLDKYVSDIFDIIRYIISY